MDYPAKETLALLLLCHDIKSRNMIQYVNGCMGSLIGVNYPQIIHQWDIWHATKNLSEKLSKVCKYVLHIEYTGWVST